MTCSDDLGELIDQLLTGKDWHAIRIFNHAACGAKGYTVSLCRDQVTANVDQLPPEARPSEKLRSLLKMHLGKKSLPVIGASPDPIETMRFLEEELKTCPDSRPSGDFDDVLG